jgi:hypothetical protein
MNPKRKLVDRLRPVHSRPVDTHMGSEPYDGERDGITTDGVHHGLDGQPPVAKSRGWGDLSWLRRRR